MNDCSILSKSNALTRAAIEKEESLGNLRKKKAELIEMKEYL